MHQTFIIIFRIKKRFWVVHFMSVLLVKHLFFKRCVQNVECCQFCLWFSILPAIEDVHYNFQNNKEIELSILCQFCWWNIYFFRKVCKLQSVVNFDYDFSMLPTATDIHYNFQIKKEILSCPFYSSFVGESFIFLRDVFKLQSVVNFDCDFSMLLAAIEVHYNF